LRILSSSEEQRDSPEYVDGAFPRQNPQAQRFCTWRGAAFGVVSSWKTLQGDVVASDQV
jgi:hypothetical protein